MTATTSITSRHKAKRFALSCAAATRPTAKFTRVGKEFLDAVEANTRAFIANRVHSHPSVGMTLK